MNIDSMTIQSYWATPVDDARVAPRQRWSWIHVSDLRARIKAALPGGR